MPLDSATIKAFAIELAAVMPPQPPRKIELVLATGETLSHEAMQLARLYDRATCKQRAALDASAALIWDRQGSPDFDG